MGGGRYLDTSGVLRAATDEEIEELEAVAGGTAGASREQRQQAKASAKQAKFEADCEAVLECLPESPASLSREELLAALSAAGHGCSAPTLYVRMAALVDSGRAVDLSNGSKGRPRRWARATGGGQ